MITEERQQSPRHLMSGARSQSPRNVMPSRKPETSKNFAKRKNLTVQTSSPLKRFATSECETPQVSGSCKRLENLNAYDSVLSPVPLTMAEDISRTCTAFLYIGSINVAHNKELLLRAGITHVVDCSSSEPPPTFTNHFTYKSLPITDIPSEDITSYFREVRSSHHLYSASNSFL